MVGYIHINRLWEETNFYWNKLANCAAGRGGKKGIGTVFLRFRHDCTLCTAKERDCGWRNGSCREEGGMARKMRDWLRVIQGIVKQKKKRLETREKKETTLL